MRTLISLLCLTLMLGATNPAKAEGDPRPLLWEFLTVERYAQAFLQVGAMALRDQIDFTYDDITADFHSGTISLHGLQMYPEVPWQSNELCIVEAERATIAGANPAEWDRLKIRIALFGAVVTPGCVMPPFNFQLAAVGIKDIDLSRFEIEIDYHVGPAELEITTHMTLADLAAIAVNVDFEYFAIKKQDDVVAYLSGASVTYEDLGLWAKAQPLIPPELQNPDNVAGMIQGGLASALQDMNGNVPLTPDQQNLVASAVRSVRSFMADPGTLTIEVAPEQSVFLNTDAAANFQYLFQNLKPNVTTGHGSRTPIINAAKLRAALSAPQMLSDEEKLQIGMALLSGVGAPKAVGPARALLQPLAGAGNGDAAVALAESLQDEEPAAAYRLASQAAIAEAYGAARVLDRLERRIATPDLLALQAENLPAPSEDGYATLSAMRANAIAHLSGLGQQRSYARAYYWASLASATGDGAAQSLIAEIEDRMRYRGDAAASAWRQASEAAANDALATWLDKGLAARFSAGR